MGLMEKVWHLSQDRVLSLLTFEWHHLLTIGLLSQGLMKRVDVLLA